MNVICPHTCLHPITRQVLDSYNLGVAYIRLSDDDSYRRLLRSIWAAGETVVVVEQDICPFPGAIEELHACPGIWCTHSYHWTNQHGRGGVGVYHMLGLAKLSVELMQALPNVWDEPCNWADCDQRLFFAAREKGLEPHGHRPPVVHLKGMAA